LAKIFYVNGELSTKEVADSLISLGKINEDLEIIRDSLVLTLCKPSGEEICILDEAYAKKEIAQLADVDELEFNIPYYVTRQYKQEKNSHWDLIKGDYLVKLNNEKEFVIDKVEEDGSDKEIKHIHCFSSEYTLGRKNIRQFKGTRQIYRDSLFFSYNNKDWFPYVNSIIKEIGSVIYFQIRTQNSEILDTYAFTVTTGNTTFERLDIVCSNVSINKGIIDVQLITPDLKIEYSYDNATWAEYEILDKVSLNTSLSTKKSELEAINDSLDIIESNKVQYQDRLSFYGSEVDRFYALMIAEEGIAGSPSYTIYEGSWNNAKSQIVYYQELLNGIPALRANKLIERKTKLDEIEILEAKIDGTQIIINPYQTLFLHVISVASGKLIAEYEWTSSSIPLSTPDIFVRSTDLTNGSKALEIKINAETGIGILNLLEQETAWRVGFIDNAVREYTSNDNSYRVYRTFDITEKSWLDFLKNDFQDAFGCIVTFDTINKLVNVYGSKTLGSNRGLYISDENYLEKIRSVLDHDEIVTRLYVTGNDGLTINQINPTGYGYIEDFSFYTGESYDKIEYFTPSLLASLKKYETVTIPSKQAELAVLKANLKSHRENLGIVNNQISTAKYELASIQDIIDVRLQQGLNYSDTLVSKTSKEAEIASLEQTKATHELAIADILNQINDISLGLLKQNPDNFNEEDLKLLSHFVKESTWNDSTCIDEEELLARGKEYLKEVNIPLITFSTDIVDFLNIVECQHDWDKLRLGDYVTLYYEKFNIDIEVRLIKISHSIDDNSLSIEFSTKDIVEDSNKYLATIVSNTNTASNVISSNKENWDLSGQNHDLVTNVIESNLNAARNRVLSGRNQNIDISERGISLREIGDNREQLKLLNNVLAFTTDNWQTASLAITPYGVYAPAVYGKLLAGNKLLITNESGSFKVDGNSMIAHNMYLSLENDFNRVLLDPNIGIKLQRMDAGWKDIMWLDINTGILHTKHMVATSIIIKDDGENTLIDAKNNIFNIGKFDDILADGRLTTVEKMQLKAEWIRIQSEYARIVLHANDYNTIDRDSKQHTTAILTIYMNAYNALSTYIPLLNLDSEKTTVVDREVFNTRFRNYYDAAVAILNEISNVLRYSSLQLGQMYNTTVIDAINGITVTKTPNPDGSGTPIARTVLNATDGIAIYSLIGGTPVPKFWVDMEGWINARHLRIFDGNNQTAVKLTDAGDVEFNGHLKVWNANWTKLMLEAYRDSNGGKLLINDINGVLNSYMGSSPSGSYKGGFLKLYENGEGSERIELVTHSNDHAGTIYLKDNSGTKIKISAKDGSLNHGVISLYGEDGNPKLTFRARSETDNMSGTLGGDRRTGGYIQFKSYNDSEDYFITVNNENNFGMYDKNGSCFEINHSTGALYIYHHEKSEIALEKGRIYLMMTDLHNLYARYYNDDTKIYRVPVTVKGSSSFASTAGRTITHNLGFTTYEVSITPTGNPTGRTGDIGVVKNANSIVVYNTGDGTGSFDYVIYV